jgi:peptide/nickel transport system permease protein
VGRDLSGLMITVAVASFNFLGDGLRDALDPRHVRSGGQA